MSAGDNTRDDRWRPGLASSERRVREELAYTAPRIASRELSFVPRRRVPTFAAHDPQTEALIAEYKRLELLPHGPSLCERVEEWKYLNAMRGPEEKQQYLERLIEAVRSDPASHEDKLLFLLIALEPIRRGVSRMFVHAHGGVSRVSAADWSDRTAARTIREIERQTLFDVTREAALEAIFLYPTPPPDRLFPWFRTVISRHAVRQLRKDLTDNKTSLGPAEAEAQQLALAGLSEMKAPVMRDESGIPMWRRGIERGVRDLYSIAEEFYREDGIREACRTAIGRLPRVQGLVMEAVFYRGRTPEAIAETRGISRSTVYNHEAKAKKNMERDDCFFSALHHLGAIRDQARAAEIREKYPDGKLPDGRRIVLIDQAA